VFHPSAGFFVEGLIPSSNVMPHMDMVNFLPFPFFSFFEPLAVSLLAEQPPRIHITIMMTVKKAEILFLFILNAPFFIIQAEAIASSL
jgi:hypothetical protein